MARLTIRIDLAADAALGPGKARLLEAVDAAGSIRGAATAIGMSYRRAWLLLQDVEAVMGAPVVSGETGGANGGGTSLTKLGRAVVDQYRTIEKRASRAVAAELRKLTAMTKARSAFPKKARPANSRAQRRKSARAKTAPSRH
jgi:molybdate transport system regulatory protein